MALAQRARVPLAFDRARDRFLQTLTEDEEKCFSQSTSIDDIYSLAEELQKEQGSRGSLRNMGRIEPFLTGMTQYAKVIEVFVQVKPEIMALIWGPLKLLLQLASQFTESFEKVLDAIGQIGECLPRFRKFAVAFSYSDQMQEVISTVYEDIMNFYRHALQFFNRRAWKIIFTLTWSSFETQFGLILRNLQRHQALVDAEACAEDIIQSQKAREEEQKRAEEYQLEDMHRKMKDIRDWLKPVNVTDLREKCERLKQDGTGKWLLENKDMKGWIAGKGKKSIWLTGKPGSGKTILSYTVLEHLEERMVSTNTPGLVLYFFCSYEQADLIVCQNILCTLIYQIISQKKDLIAYVYPEISKLLSVSTLQKLLYNLIEASVSLSEFVYIIIDGIDELLSREREIILQTLTELRQNSAALASRIFVASRDLTNIRSAFEKKKPKAFEIPIKESNRRDIHQYIVSESQRVVEEVIPKGGPEQQLLQKEIENSLSTRADGMFLWVHLVIESLLSQDSIKEIREALIDLPEGLGQVYERIIGRIRRLDEKQKIKANKILEWMSCTYRPLRIEELEDALSIEHCDLTLDKEKRQTIIRLRRLCGPIIEISNGIVTFAHFTAKEYLQDKRSGPFIDCLNSHLSISLVCITYQCFRCYELGVSIDEGVTLLLNGDLRLFDYVHSNWVEHIQEFFRLGPNRAQVEILSASLKELFRKRASSKNPYQANDRLNSRKDEFTHFEPKLKASFSGVLDFREDLETLKLSLGPGIDLSRWSDMKNPLTLLRGARRLQDILEKYILNGWPPDPFKVEAAHKAYGKNLYFCTYTFCQNSSSRGFSTQAERRLHEKRFHTQTHKCPVEYCTWADRAFASEASLRTHTSKYHPAPPKKTSAINIEILSELFEEMKYGGGNQTWLQDEQLAQNAKRPREQQTQPAPQLAIESGIEWNRGTQAFQKRNPTDQQGSIQLSAQNLAAHAGLSIIPQPIQNYQEPYSPQPAQNYQEPVLLSPNLLQPPPLLDLQQQTSRLRLACRDGSAMEVKSILQQDQAKEIWDIVNDGELLATVCSNGHLEVVRILAEHGAAINQPLKLKSMPLFNAVYNGHTDVVKYLLELGADPRGRFPPCGLGVSQEVREEIEKLIDAVIRRLNEEDLQRLSNAITQSDTAAVEDILQSVPAKIFLEESQYLLNTACQKGNLEIVRMLIKKGARINPHSPGSDTGPLGGAVFFGHTHVVEYLLNLGADPRDKTLEYAFATRQAREEIKELIDTTIQRLNEEDLQRLSNAITQSDTAAVEDILQSSPARKLLEESQTFLNIACEKGDLEIVRILIEKGARVNPSSPWSSTSPLKSAVFYGRTGVVGYLLNLGADPRGVLQIPAQYRYMSSNSEVAFHIEGMLRSARARTEIHGAFTEP